MVRPGDAVISRALPGLAGGRQVLVAVTLRDDPGDDPGLAAWTDQMRAAGLATEVPLGPFETSDTARLATAISGRDVSAPDARLLQATTGGFPLYIIEAVRGTAEPGPGAPAGASTPVGSSASSASGASIPAGAGIPAGASIPAGAGIPAGASPAPRDLTTVLRRRLDQT